MTKRVLAAGVALAVLVSMPAAAADADFRACDGYPAPSKKADGVTQGTWLFGMAAQTTDIRRDQHKFGADQAARCDAALADPLLQPKFWLRRGHLLQAKGMHLIETGDLEGAFQAFAASEAIGAEQKDLFFNRSVGLGNRILRALAYFRQGKTDAALAELDMVDRARPYAADLRRLTMSIRLDNMKGLDARRALMLASAPMDPSVLQQLFWISLFYGDFAQVVALGPQIGFDIPIGRDDWQIEGTGDHEYEAIVRRAEVAGAAAYALAALGKGDAAKAAMARARAEIEAVIQPPVTPANGKLKRSVVNDYERRKGSGASATAKLDEWQALIGLMERAPGMTLEGLGLAIRDAGLRDSPVVLHLLTLVKPKLDSDIAMQRRLVSQLETRRDTELNKVWKMSFSDMVTLLPRPERLQMNPRYQPAGDGFMVSDADGFYVKREKDSPYINVRFGSDTASRAMVEEASMLAAAMKARELGKDSFLLDSRMSVQRTVRVYGYGGGFQSSYPNGYETRLRILAVNAAELPAALEHSRWRLIRVADVIDALQARYRPPPRVRYMG